MLHGKKAGDGSLHSTRWPSQHSLGACKSVRARVARTLEAGEDACVDVGLRGVGGHVDDLQPVGVAAPEVLEFTPYQAPEVGVLVVWPTQ